MAKLRPQSEMLSGSPSPNFIGYSPSPILAKRDPLSSDTGFSLGQQWINKISRKVFSLASVSAGVANWVATGGGTDTYPASPFVVGPVGHAGYQTIQSAIDACHAAGGGFVLIQRGTYTENLNLKTGVSLNCDTANCDPNDVAIYGTHVPPSELGVCGFRFLNFYSDSGSIFNSTAAGQCYIISDTVNWVLTQPGYVFNLPNWTGPLTPLAPVGTPGLAIVNCGDLSTASSGFINNANGGMIMNLLFSYIGSQQGAGGSIALTTSGTTQFSECDIFCPINFNGGTGTGPLANYIETSTMHGFPVTLSGNSQGFIVDSAFDGLTDPAITMSSSGNWYVAATNIDTTSTPAIAGSGAGELTLAGISFTKNSTLAGTLTLNTSSAFVAGEIRANADVGGSEGFTSLTNSNSTTIGAGVGSVKMTSGNSANNTAWIKIYVGTTPYWIPAWATNSP